MAKKNEVKNWGVADLKGGAEDGANSAGIQLILDSMKWTAIDINDPEQVKQRIIDYFELMAKHDTKPLVNAYAHALGMDRKRLWELVNNVPCILQGDKYPSCDKINKESLSIIQEGYSLLSESWEYNFANGKFTHPAVGIFLGKNHFGYVDQQDVVVENRNILGNPKDEEELEKKYRDSIVI